MNGSKAEARKVAPGYFEVKLLVGFKMSNYNPNNQNTRVKKSYKIAVHQYFRNISYLEYSSFQLVTGWVTTMGIFKQNLIFFIAKHVPLSVLGHFIFHELMEFKKKVKCHYFHI